MICYGEVAVSRCGLDL